MTSHHCTSNFRTKIPLLQHSMAAPLCAKSTMKAAMEVTMKLAIVFLLSSMIPGVPPCPILEFSTLLSSRRPLNSDPCPSSQSDPLVVADPPVSDPPLSSDSCCTCQVTEDMVRSLGMKRTRTCFGKTTCHGFQQTVIAVNAENRLKTLLEAI